MNAQNAKQEPKQFMKTETEVPQTIDLTQISLYCPTCLTAKNCENRNNIDICCNDCHTIITAIHPRKP